MQSINVNLFSLRVQQRQIFVSLVLAALFVFGVFTRGYAAPREKISRDLAYVLQQTDKPVPVIVLLRPVPLMPQNLLGHVNTAGIERLIKQRALQMQADLRQTVNDMIGKPGLSGEVPIRRVKYFWNVNGMMATATPDTIMQLADREDVSVIIYDRKIKLAPDHRHSADAEGEYTYGLQKIGVPALREKFPTMGGQGVTVGIVDTGIDAEHPELKGKLVAFKDFVNSQEKPYDDHGHGTHVAGTISGTGVGGTQIGIAPAVHLVIAKVFGSSGSAETSGILRGMEWVANPDGKPESPNRPRVINNSWGGGMPQDIADDAFAQAVTTWVQLNIFPSFAAGNAGPEASTVGSPGGLPQAFGVGATDENDAIADFSSRGPVNLIVDGKKTTYIKPDVSAPGFEVYSAAPGNRYVKMSGTSMATPHVTGSVALMVQAKPDATVAQLRESMTKSSQDLGDAGNDNTFGAGRLNVFGAVQQLRLMKNSIKPSVHN